MLLEKGVDSLPCLRSFPCIRETPNRILYDFIVDYRPERARKLFRGSDRSRCGRKTGRDFSLDGFIEHFGTNRVCHEPELERLVDTE